MHSNNIDIDIDILCPPRVSRILYTVSTCVAALCILRVMALKGEANNVLEITRALVDGKESEMSFEENMRLLRHSVRATSAATVQIDIPLNATRAIAKQSNNDASSLNH